MPAVGHPEMCLCVCVCADLLSLDQSKTFYKPDWFDIVGAEVKCCKEAVCVIDMSSFTKFELTVSLDGNSSVGQSEGLCHNSCALVVMK